MRGSKIMIIFAVVFLIVGLFVIVAGLLPPPPLVDGEALAYTEITEENSYYIQDLAVFWNYGSMTGTDDSGAYYLAYFADKNGDVCTVSLYFDNSKAWKATSDAHDYSETDMLMGGCFRAQTVASVDASMKLYYEECLADFRSISSSYIGTNNIKDTGLHFKYLCDERAEYTSAARAPLPQFIFGGLMVLMAGLFFYLFKKVKEAEENTLRIHMATGQFDPFTGAPMASQSPYGTQQPYPPQPPYGGPQGYPSAPGYIPPQPQSPSEDRDNYQGPEF